MAAPKRTEEPKTGAPGYMVTYGDMMTLLLCFFVMMYSMSNVDVEKFQALSESFSKSPSKTSANSGINGLLGSGIIEMPKIPWLVKEEEPAVEDPSVELAQMATSFRTYLEQKNLQDQIMVENEAEYIGLRFSAGILFDRGSANLREDVIPVLDIIAEELQNYEDNDIRIEGHTDTDPINSPLYPNNLYLSAARAIAVGLYFIEEKGFDPIKITTEGIGEYRPISDNDSEEGKAKNRRVEIKIMKKVVSSEN